MNRNYCSYCGCEIKNRSINIHNKDFRNTNGEKSFITIKKLYINLKKMKK